jgi:hypothetical protein
VLPSAPSKSVSRQLLIIMKDFIHNENHYKGEPIAPKADLSALYMAAVANPMIYHQWVPKTLRRLIGGAALASLSLPLPSSLLPSSPPLSLLQPLPSSVSSSSSSSSSSNDLPCRKPLAAESSLVDGASTSSSEVEKSHSQDMSSSSSSSNSLPRRSWRSSPSVRDSSSSDQAWKSYSSTSQCRGAQVS